MTTTGCIPRRLEPFPRALARKPSRRRVLGRIPCQGGPAWGGTSDEHGERRGVPMAPVIRVTRLIFAVVTLLVLPTAGYAADAKARELLAQGIADYKALNFQDAQTALLKASNIFRQNKAALTKARDEATGGLSGAGAQRDPQTGGGDGGLSEPPSGLWLPANSTTPSRVRPGRHQRVPQRGHSSRRPGPTGSCPEAEAGADHDDARSAGQRNRTRSDSGSRSRADARSGGCGVRRPHAGT